jgi:membrane associated rhomboid family serine protease
MITFLIIAITAVISILAFYNKELQGRLLFSPIMIAEHRQGYRFVTHAFVHADWMHLAVNMFVLLSFGSAVEGYFADFFGPKGWYFYILLYLGGILLSSTPSFAKHKSNKFYHAVGASGAVSAVVFASILISPLTGIRFIFIPFDIPAFIFGGLYLVFSAYMAKKGNDNIGHDAHFWGAVFGLVFTLILEPSLGASFIEQIAAFAGFV